MMPASNAHAREFKEFRARLASLREAGDVEGRRAELDRMVQRHPRAVRVQRLAAQQYLALGDFTRAIAALRNLLRLQPGDAKTRERLARALAANGAAHDALDILLPVVETAPTAPRLTVVADLYREMGQTGDALAALRRAVDMNAFHEPAWGRMISLLDGVGRHDEADEARRRAADIPRKLSPREVVDRIQAARPDDAPRFVVNIGCRDGMSWEDPCYELYQAGYPGIAVDAGDFPDLYRNLPQADVRKLLKTPLTPSNVLPILEREGCPERLSLLKIDIDGFDGVLLKAALERLRPNVIQIEVNPEIPPPLQFAIEYDARYRHSGVAGFFGCSVSYLTALCRPLGYELLEIDLSNPPMRQDAILVRREYLALWREGPVDERELFLREPVAVGGFRQIGVDSAAWRSENDYDRLLTDVWDACVAASLHRSGRVLPFVLSR